MRNQLGGVVGLFLEREVLPGVHEFSVGPGLSSRSCGGCVRTPPCARRCGCRPYGCRPRTAARGMHSRPGASRRRGRHLVHARPSSSTHLRMFRLEPCSTRAPSPEHRRSGYVTRNPSAYVRPLLGLSGAEIDGHTVTNDVVYTLPPSWRCAYSDLGPAPTLLESTHCTAPRTANTGVGSLGSLSPC